MARIERRTARPQARRRSPEGQWEPLERYADEYLPSCYRDVAAGAGHWGADTWPIREFVQAITGGSSPPIDVYAALDMTLPGLVSEQSIAQGGAWLAVPDPRFWTPGLDVEPGKEAPHV